MTTTSVTASSTRPSRLGRLFSRRNIGQFGIVFVVLAMLLVFALVSDRFVGVFFHPNNLANVGRQTTLLLITAFAMTFIILIGEIDISIGAIGSIACVMIAVLLRQDVPFPIAMVTGILTGTLCGLVNGLITVLGKIPSFIVTLGTLSMIRGLALAITNASTITFRDNTYRRIFARANPLEIPAPVWFAAGIFIVLFFVLTRTRFGANIYAVGGSETSARLAGIAVRRVKIVVFTLAGAVTSLAAIVYTARLGNGQPEGMIGFELDAIAAVVIGGTSFVGGRGSLARTVLGALLIGILNNALTLMNVTYTLQLVTKGMVIIVAVLIDTWTRTGSQS
ncbi:MAG: ABC transporter permease [Deinococcota bacterium]